MGFILLFVTLLLLFKYNNLFLNNYPAPQDRITEDQIYVGDNHFCVENIPNNRYIAFEGTKSMIPLIDKGNNVIEIIPQNESEIKEGDIVSYHSNIINFDIIHRVYYVGYDEIGWYILLKGDNLQDIDPERVRWNQIKGVVIAIIY